MTLYHEMQTLMQGAIARSLFVVYLKVNFVIFVNTKEAIFVNPFL